MISDFEHPKAHSDELSEAAIQILHRELYKRTAMQIGMGAAEKIAGASSSEEQLKLMVRAIEEAESITAEYITKIAMVVFRTALRDAREKYEIPIVFSEKIVQATHIQTNEPTSEVETKIDQATQQEDKKEEEPYKLFEKKIETLRLALAKETAVLLPMVASKQINEITDSTQRMLKILHIVELAESVTARYIAQIAQAIVQEAVRLHSTHDDIQAAFLAMMHAHAKIKPWEE